MRVLLLVVLLSIVSGAYAADIYVNNVTGNDSFDGLSEKVAGKKGPFATIHKAIEQVKPGDTIHLAPTDKVYRETVQFTNKGGEPGKPITVDGHGAWLTGADHCDPAGWKPFPEGEPGTLTRDDLIEGGPWFALCIDRKRVGSERDMDVLNPGEFCYTKNPATLYFLAPDLKKVKSYKITAGFADGTTMEVDGSKWQISHSKNRSVRRNRTVKKKPTWVKIDGKDAPIITAPGRLKPGQWCRQDKSVYYRPPEGKTINDLKILAVPRACGVSLLGKCGHFVIKNLNVVYVGNDGYNIHGNVKDAKFYNCNAYYCYDEGFSSHDTCETLLDGATYVYCDNGIANVNKSLSVTRNVLIDEAIHVGILLTTKGSPGVDQVSDVVLVNNPSQLDVNEANVDNALIIGTKAVKRAPSGMNLGAKVTVKHATLSGNGQILRVGNGSSVTIEDSFFGPKQKKIHARTDDPASVVSFKNITFGPDLIMEWSAKYPWKSKPLGEWFKSVGDKAVDCQQVDLDIQADVDAGAIPKTIPKGCSETLFKRYADYLKQKDAVLKKALDMAWGK